MWCYDIRSSSHNLTLHFTHFAKYCNKELLNLIRDVWVGDIITFRVSDDCDVKSRYFVKKTIWAQKMHDREGKRCAEREKKSPSKNIETKISFSFFFFFLEFFHELSAEKNLVVPIAIFFQKKKRFRRWHILHYIFTYKNLYFVTYKYFYRLDLLYKVFASNTRFSLSDLLCSLQIWGERKLYLLKTQEIKNHVDLLWVWILFFLRMGPTDGLHLGPFVSVVVPTTSAT